MYDYKFRIWRNSIQDERLQKILCSFGGQVIEGNDYTKPPDNETIDVIFGSWKDRDIPHHKLKREVVKNSNHVIVMESPLMGRGPVSNVLQDDWIRVGLDGFMGDSLYPEVDPERFKNLLVETGFGKTVTMDTRSAGDYILLVLQLPGDASLFHTDINKWMRDSVAQIRKITDRDIVIRFPQISREYDMSGWWSEYKGIYFQHGTHEDKQVTFDNAYAVVTYSSGMGVEALSRGIRTYIEAPQGFKNKDATLTEVLRSDYQNFDTVKEFDTWLNSVVQTEWHVDEIADGSCREAFAKLLGDMEENTNGSQ